MKRALLPLLSLAILASCRHTEHRQEVVKETYLHKYGVPVPKSDWNAGGQEGKIVQLKKDGVTVTSSYNLGQLHGEKSATFPNSSTLQSVEIYERDELVACIQNYPSGVPLVEERFEHGRLVEFTRWYADGTPAATESYENGYLLHGEYRTAANAIESEVRHGYGIRICRENNGILLSKERIEEGQKVEKITYFSSGDPATITPYEDGQIHGTRLTFLEAGLPLTVEEWVHGMQDGITTIFQNGEKVSEMPYHLGVRQGIENRFRDGYELVEEVTWREDLQQGIRKIFVDDVTKVEWYHQGELVSKLKYDKLNTPR